jgi:hypothetical protein
VHLFDDAVLYGVTARLVGVKFKLRYVPAVGRRNSSGPDAFEVLVI